jgi:hypothetical protein
MVRALTETITIPKELLRDLYSGLAKVEEVLATIEELMDKEGIERIRKAEAEYKKGDYVAIRDSQDVLKHMK